MLRAASRMIYFASHFYVTTAFYARRLQIAKCSQQKDPAQMMNLVFADGSKTPKEMWLEQNAGTLPEPLSQQEIDRVKNQPDGRKDLLLTRMHEK
ncbi:uncharacterized protein J4E79_002608 [Alternaria viburni]|uniref:uncharacterized protein n=1 Tax=Alternaria viburni TaxID=566460 RepID=UPI0020C3FE54|nr:uncharacterized protein J4E79_002608 [Alternaria viburni]KAI4666569.1 hypothetical protein J4E79_002608 [Alternaria viburni]